MFSRKTSNSVEMLNELLEKNIKHYKIRNSKYKSIDQFELPVTLAKEAKKKYGMDIKQKVYLINNFESLGMTDPFSNED